MRIFSPAILLIFISCSAATIDLPPSPDHQPAVSDQRFAESIDAARATVEPLLAEYPGLTVAVAVDGTMVWSDAFGWADVESRTAATPATIFRLYSSSKAITATLAMRMAEQRRLDLDDAIGTYLADLPSEVSSLTLRQLLAHRAGIRHYRKGEWLSVSNKRCTFARDALAPFITDPLVHSPGTKYNYSSFGYVLASAVIEAAAKGGFYEVLDGQVLSPSGMHATGDEHDAPPQLRATPYEKAGDGVRLAIRSDSSCKFGAGGLVGTSEDLVRFGVALSEGELVSPAGLASLFQAMETAPGRPGYGLGFTLESDPELGLLATHSGGALGGRSFLLISPERKIVVALAGNLEGANLGSASVAIARAFAGE